MQYNFTLERTLKCNSIRSPFEMNRFNLFLIVSLVLLCHVTAVKITDNFRPSWCFNCGLKIRKLLLQSSREAGREALVLRVNLVINSLILISNHCLICRRKFSKGNTFRRKTNGRTSLTIEENMFTFPSRMMVKTFTVKFTAKHSYKNIFRRLRAFQKSLRSRWKTLRARREVELNFFHNYL